jgi:hypothetical protein
LSNSFKGFVAFAVFSRTPVGCIMISPSDP